MTIELLGPVAANGPVDGFDVRQVKRALNRLGYYQPYPKIGMTDVSDKAMFDAVKSFQKDNWIKFTDVLGDAYPILG